MIDDITVRASGNMDPAVVALTAELQKVVVEMFGPALVDLWREDDRPGRYYGLEFVMGRARPDDQVLEFTVSIHIDRDGEMRAETVGFSGSRKDLDNLDIDAELDGADELSLSEAIQGLPDASCECGVCAPKDPALLH
jgi:hypothetical protein